MPIARGEQRGLAVAATLPDRADRMDNIAGRQSIATGQARVAGLTAAERAAFGEQFGTCGTMDCAVDATATKERRVRRVDDGIDGQGRDVDVARLDSGSGKWWALARSLYVRTTV